MIFPAICCLLAGTVLGFVDKQSPPQWSDVYTVRGVIIIPYAELVEPFYAWFDRKHDRSRIDYYGGMAKTYQLGAAAYKPFGSSVKIVPVTTESALNQKTCLQVNGSDKFPAAVQSVLPDLTDFTYLGEETMRDSDTSKWRMVSTVGDKVSKYTMWLKYKKTLRGDNVPIPVRYEMRGYNSLLGSHYDHYMLDYSEYDVSEIDQSVLDPFEKDMSCSSFPGPGHRVSFNPMQEFMHPANEEHLHDEFNRFKVKHNKKYASEVEHTKRRDIFRQNLRFISSGNRAGRSYSLGVNHLADRTAAERAVLRGRRYSGPSPGLPFPYSKEEAESVKLPPELDWRIMGAVTPVKDQSVCGSCWSFGTVGAVEGALFLHNGGHLVRLSQQALVDCSWGYGNNGCDGGEDFRAYQWIMKHGLPTEDDYGGYLGQDGYCHVDNVTLVTSMKSWVNVTADDEKALMLALFKHGPVSVAIDASHRSFSFYSHGVYYEPACKNTVEGLDHAVLAIGWGVLEGKHYWLVKNSWSNLWGNQGYVLMASRDNNCGVMTAPTYVVM